MRMKKSEINILVVDDDATFRGAMTEAIKRFGFKVTAVSKAEEALNAVKIKQYHLGLVDCMLPRQNGMDLAKEMRKTRFATAPIVLVSGVFKDKSFAAEAIEKTKAVEFLTKPFDMHVLKKVLDEQFKSLLSSENIPLQVLVSKPFSSTRERTKVIEGLEEVKGIDLPFVLCVLVDAGASGHLNIANASGEIYGITLQQGKIVNVDSGEKEANVLMLLMELGYLNREDLAAVQNKGRRGDIVAMLIENQFISPHVLPIVNKEQVLSDLRRLFMDNSLKINFVPERSSKESDIGYTIEDLTPLLHEIVRKAMSLEYLKAFYQDWIEYPIQVGTLFQVDHPIFQQELFTKLPQMAELLNKHLTIEELKAQGHFDEETLFKCLHLLAFRRMIIFDDVKKVKGAVEYSDRARTMLKELQNKNPFQVFGYFGVAEGAKDAEVEKVYREFARANHPDLLPPTTSADMRKIVNQLFSIVSEAHDALISPDKRAKLVESLKQREAEQQIQAENLADEAIILLQRGSAKEALEKTTKAYSLYSSRGIKIAHSWALLRSGEGSARALEISKMLESIPHEERRMAQYAFVSGLLKKILGDIPGATAQFDKSIAMDPNFLEARREKSALSGQNQKVDLFKADLGQIVGNFFKKRK